VAIEATKEGVKFSCTGDIGNGAVTLRSHTNMDKPEQNVDINLSEPVALTFSLKYLVNFCKASGLSSTVKLCLSNEVPLLVEYTLASNSYLRFYLAPKVCSYGLDYFWGTHIKYTHSSSLIDWGRRVIIIFDMRKRCGSFVLEAGEGSRIAWITI
jgi:hypothetical protein